MSFISAESVLLLSCRRSSNVLHLAIHSPASDLTPHAQQAGDKQRCAHAHGKGIGCIYRRTPPPQRPSRSLLVLFNVKLFCCFYTVHLKNSALMQPGKSYLKIYKAYRYRMLFWPINVTLYAMHSRSYSKPNYCQSWKDPFRVLKKEKNVIEKLYV